MKQFFTLDAPLLLVGGGEVDSNDLIRLTDFISEAGGAVIGVDGGADHLAAEGLVPDLVIGDLDSLTRKDVWQSLLGEALIHVDQEQDTTDLEKSLERSEAPITIGIGFLEDRFDHALAAMHALVSNADRKIVLLGRADLVFAAPAKLTINLPVGTRFSIFPMLPCEGTSTGLHWPIDGLRLETGAMIGTSNHTSAPKVELRMKQCGAVICVPREYEAALLKALA